MRAGSRVDMKKKNVAKLWLRLIVIAASLAALAMLLFFVLLVSFQNGARSTGLTMRVAGKIASGVFADPTAEQVETVSLMMRYGAHLALFFVVGLVTAFVSMVICSGYFRIVGILLSGGVCYFLAYYTEYFKQYISGRHFQMTDVALNWYGGVAGIVCMVVSYFLNRLLVKLSD